MREKKRVPWSDAMALAIKAFEALEPFCSEIAMAGSLRRHMRDVGDIEILTIPRHTKQVDMLGVPYGDDDLTAYLRRDIADTDGLFRLRMNVRGAAAFGARNKLLLYRGFPLDVFSADPKNWGMALMVRTGSAAWNVEIMKRFKRLGLRGHAYGSVTDRSGREFVCPTEERVFELLRWPWIPPPERDMHTAWRLRHGEHEA